MNKESTEKEERLADALLGRSTPEETENVLASLPADERNEYRAMAAAGHLFDEMCVGVTEQLAHEDDAQVIPFPGRELSDEDLNLMAAAGKPEERGLHNNENSETDGGGQRPH